MHDVLFISHYISRVTMPFSIVCTNINLRASSMMKVNNENNNDIENDIK